MSLTEFVIPVLARVGAATGAVFVLHPPAASRPGEVPMVQVLVAAAGRVRCLGVVGDLGVMRYVRVLSERDGIPCVSAVDFSALEEALVSLLRGGLVARLPLSAFDVAQALLDAFAVPGSPADLATDPAVEILSRSRRSLGTFGEHGDGPGTSGLSVSLEGRDPWLDFVRVIQRTDDVQLWLPSSSFDEPPQSLTLRTPEELSAALDGVVSRCAAALTARQAFLSRPFTGRHAGEALAVAFTTAFCTRQVSGTSYELSFLERNGFPYQRPQGLLLRRSAGEEQVAAVITEVGGAAAGVQLEVGLCTLVVGDAATMAASLIPLTEAARQDLARLTPDKLRQGATYRLLRSALGLPAGALVRFRRRELVHRFHGTDGFCFP